MDCFLDTAMVTSQQLHEYAKQLLLFINEYEWLTHAYVVEYFKKNHWSSLPCRWQECLQGLTPPQVAEVVMDIASAETIRCVWPLSLLAYKATAKALSIPRFMPPKSSAKQDESKTSDNIDLSHCYRLHVKPKKRHEIEHLSKVINSICDDTRCRHVVDVGSGQGHLSRLLSFGYGLQVTSIEAVGCHITGAAKFDREVTDFIEKKKRKKGEPSEAISNQPEHVVCTVHPQITVEEFLSVIDTGCKQTQVEDTDIIQKGPHRDVCTHDTKKARLSEDTSGALDKYRSSCDGMKTVPDTDREILPSEEVTVHQKNSFLLAGLHTCGDLGPTMLRVFAQCQTAHALASVACCYMKMSCAVNNSLIKSKSLPESEDISHAGGLFAGVQTSKLCADPSRNEDAAQVVSSTGKFVAESGAEHITDVQQSDTRDVETESKPGFPMSQWVKGQKGCDLDFEPLELACHSFDAYCNRLKENDPNLVLQGYRALLEILIQRQCPSLTQKHAGIRQIKKAVGSIKKAHQIPFEDYAAAALQKLNLESNPAASRELSDRLLPQWHGLVTFHSLRLLLGPVMESLVLVDRMLFLLEQGIDSKLVPIFDPLLSPRNFVLLATKR